MGNKKPYRAVDSEKTSKLLRLAESGDADAAYELIGYFRRGLSLEHLRDLFHSPSVRSLAGAAYIASELGSMATPLVDEFSRALRHPESWGRSAGVDCVFNCASAEMGELVADALRLIDDPSVYTRGVVLFRLRFADSRLIQAALPFLTDEPIWNHLLWFLDPESKLHSSIVQRLASPDPTVRRIALAAAARPAGSARSGEIVDRESLRLAASSQDAEVKEFAESVLESIAEIAGS